MKLVRYGPRSREKPGIVDKAGVIRDLSAVVADITPATLARAHRRGYHVHVWTIDDADEMNRLLDLGVDGIMTDRPQVLKDVLHARGEWR